MKDKKTVLRIYHEIHKHKVTNDIYQKIIATDFINKYFEGKVKNSKDKKFKAGIEVEVQHDGTQIGIVFFDKYGKEINRLPVIKVHSNRMFIKSIIGKSKWINTKEFVLTSKSEEINFKASVDKEKLDLFFTPNNNTEDQLVDALLILSTATNKAQIEYLIKDRIKEFTTKWH